MAEHITRLNKYISESGLCSRRAADRFIELGQVFINGKKAKVGDKVLFGDLVTVNGQNIEPQQAENTVILAYNKPVGITSTTEAKVKGNIVDHVNYSERVFPIGRLDKDSQGLIFLTNNGDLVNKILRAGNSHEKEYIVTVDKPVTEDFLTGMASGVSVMGIMTKKCKVVKDGNNSFKITLIQGLNRQIRRMCEHFGFDVVKLERIRIMNISTKGLPVGDWRELSEEEQKQIYKQVAKSSSEKPAHQKKAASKSTPQKEEKNGKVFVKGKPAPRGQNEDKRTAPFGRNKGVAEEDNRKKSPLGKKSAKTSDAGSDWFKHGPSRRAQKPSNGKSGVARAKTKSPKRG
jgi:23S rRNA pseudouridine2604 synthase